MKKYIIWAPKYCHSNGVRVLYRLRELLEERGYEAYMYAPESDYDSKYLDKITPHMRKNDIVIYPEIVYHNPLQFQNVVRYVLYYPGKNGGTLNYEDYEYKITYSENFYPQTDILAIPTLNKKLYFKDETSKDTDCYFVYKGGKWKDIPEFKNMVEINMQYPETREELSKLLRRTKTLYSYDDCTLLLDEACMCGCNVKIVRKDGFEDYNSNYDSAFEDLEKQLDVFIEKTQSMNYTGPIKKLSFSRKEFKIRIKKFIYKNIIPNKKRYNKYKQLEENIKFSSTLAK